MQNRIKKVKVILMTLAILVANLGVYVEQLRANSGTESPKIETTNSKNEKPETAAEEPAFSVMKMFFAGGWAMWPLLLLSIIGSAIIMERIFYFSVTNFVNKSYQHDLQDHLAESGIAGVAKMNEKFATTKVLKEGLEIANNDPEVFSKTVENESGSLIVRCERGLSILAAISTIAPLIGFLGTVSGMINAFDAIATADTVNAKVVAGGIKEALITTATGLIVGIPAMAFFQFFSGKVNSYALNIEQAANSIYKQLLRKTTPANHDITERSA